MILSVFIRERKRELGRGKSTSFRVVVRTRFYKCKVPVYQELNKETSCSSVEEPKSGGRVAIGSEKDQVLNLSPSSK